MTKPGIVETIFKQGNDANERGVLRSESPYNEGSVRYADWSLGWAAALKASRGDASFLKAKSDTVRIDDAALVSHETQDIRILGDLPKEE